MSRLYNILKAGLLTSKTFSVPGVTITAGTPGTVWDGQNVNISQSGLTPLFVVVESNNNPGGYNATVSLNYNDNPVYRAYVCYYRVRPDSYTVPATSLKIRVFYKKSP